MMKKARKPPTEASMVPPATYPMSAVGDDAMATLKLQNLMQDYEELLRDAATKRRRLRMGRQKLLRLTDEVKFLRRRYKHLTWNASHPSYKAKAQPLKAVSAPKYKARKSPGTVSDRTQIQDHLPQNERSHREEAVVPSTSTILDLNEISQPNGEEEVFQVAWEPLPMERFSARYPSEGDVPGGDVKLSLYGDVGSRSSQMGKRKISRRDQNGGGDLQVAWEPLPTERSLMLCPSEGDALGREIKLSVCRDIGSGGSRAGKRKISWQDQVALKV